MGSNMTRNKGFTIIELMVVISIVSILAVMALSAYSDYATRAKVAEGVGFAASAKTAVTNSYYTLGYVPTDNSAAGMEPPISYASQYVSSVGVNSVPVPGTITIVLSMPILGTDNQLQLVPSIVNEFMTWTCLPASTNGIDLAYVPANCRG